MGYELHIHRKTNWFDDGPSISDHEWKAVFSADSSLLVDGEIYYRIDERDVTAPIVAWRAGKADEAVFHLYKGEVTVNTSNDSALAKAWEIASKLDARLQGDDGEFYGPEGKPLKE